MINIKIDSNKIIGNLKPVHGLNNGARYTDSNQQNNSSVKILSKANIPYIRIHNASFKSSYGQEHTVDISGIFPNFDKDPSNPDNYDFALTDDYLINQIGKTGAKVFYRLGQKTEYGKKKYGILPPKDFHKWAVICENIIRHFNCGWANGYNLGIEYWEIWNAPDFFDDNTPLEKKTTWGGTFAEFCEFYNVVYNHLSSKFPQLKIGGCAFSNEDKIKLFLDNIDKEPSFLSWNFFDDDVHKMQSFANNVRLMLDKRGFYNTKSIISGYNYLIGRTGDDWYNSIEAINGLEGACFNAAMMIASNLMNIDIMMYYNATPGKRINGLFDSDTTLPKKGYYAFTAYDSLYKLNNTVDSQCDNDDLFVLSASNDNITNIMLAFPKQKELFESVDLSFLGKSENIKAEYYLLNEDNNLDLVREEWFNCINPTMKLEIHSNDVFLIKIIENIMD